MNETDYSLNKVFNMATSIGSLHPIDVNNFPTPAPELALGLKYANENGAVILVNTSDCEPDYDCDAVSTEVDVEHELSIYNSLKYGGLDYDEEPGHARWDEEKGKWLLKTSRSRWKGFCKLNEPQYPIRPVEAVEGYDSEVSDFTEALKGDLGHNPHRIPPWETVAEIFATRREKNRAWYHGQPKTKLDSSVYDYTWEIWLSFYKRTPGFLRKWGDETSKQNFPKKIYNKMSKLVSKDTKVRKLNTDKVKEEFLSVGIFEKLSSQGKKCSILNINDYAANAPAKVKTLIEAYHEEKHLVWDLYNTKSNVDDVLKGRNGFVEQFKNSLANLIIFFYNEKYYVGKYLSLDLSEEKIKNIKIDMYQQIMSHLTLFVHPVLTNETSKDDKGEYVPTDADFKLVKTLQNYPSFLVE